MNNDEFFYGIPFGVLLATLALIPAVNAYRDKQDLEFQAKAVELHAAEWAVDPKTGKTTFTWKENK